MIQDELVLTTREMNVFYEWKKKQGSGIAGGMRILAGTTRWRFQNYSGQGQRLGPNSCVAYSSNWNQNQLTF